MFFPRIKALREEFEYTQQYVADYLDIKRTTYASWETGHIILPLNIAVCQWIWNILAENIFNRFTFMLKNRFELL